MSVYRSLLRRLVAAGSLALVAVVFVAASPAHATELGCTRDPGWGEMNDAWARDVVDLVNAHRATLGLSSLGISDTLTKASEWKAAHMANYGYFSHDDESPAGTRTWDERIEDCGYTAGMGENIAFGYRDPASVVEGWIDSEGHRRNIEDPDYRVIGVGVALDHRGTPYWVQAFGTAADAVAEEDRVFEGAAPSTTAGGSATPIPESTETVVTLPDDVVQDSPVPAPEVDSAEPIPAAESPTERSTRWWGWRAYRWAAYS